MELFCVASVPTSFLRWVPLMRWATEELRNYHTVSLQWPSTVRPHDHMPLYVSIICVDMAIMTSAHRERWEDLIAYLTHFKEVPECSYFIVVVHQMIIVHYSFMLRYLCASTASESVWYFLPCALTADSAVNPESSSARCCRSPTAGRTSGLYPNTAQSLPLSSDPPETPCSGHTDTKFYIVIIWEYKRAMFQVFVVFLIATAAQWMWSVLVDVQCLTHFRREVFTNGTIRWL